ncbi:MAG: phosphotransferase [Dehalococcoidia bacterium]
MSRLSSHAINLLRVVLARYNVASPVIRDIRSGRVNKHWRVETSDAIYALRRYNPRRSPAAIRYEHDVLMHLAGRGWPIAAPLRASDGATFTEVDGQRYALFPYLAGRPAPYADPRYLHSKGQTLARLHDDLAPWSAIGQRDGFDYCWNLDTYARTRDLNTFDDLLAAFGREEPALASAVRTERDRNRAELERLGADRLPSAVVHCDFHHDNILFHRRRLSALLDFDLIHLDTRATDIATSIALDCLQPPTYDAIDPGSVQAFLGGYLIERRLDHTELRCIVPLIRTYFLNLIAFRLTQWVDDQAGRARASVARSVDRRFPNLDHRAHEIETAVRAAVENTERLNTDRSF